ncbi:MAG: DUF4177 domain-containing protein [Nocardioides sp.]
MAGKQYKVLTEKDSRFSGKFEPESLESALNSYGAEGWCVVGSFAASSVWKSMNAEVMIILERDAE